MENYIDKTNFKELDAMKYYAPPASWSEQKKKDNIKNKIFSGEWYGAEKKDGYFTKIVKDEDGNIALYSRSRNVNGEYVDKHEWVPQFNQFFSELNNGTCILGELYFPERPGSKNVTTILGCLKEKAITRQEKEKLHLYVFDVLAEDGKSYLTQPASERFETLTAFDIAYGNYGGLVEWAHYCNGNELWDLLDKTLTAGGEGIVITHQSAKYEPGKRPSKTTLKVKKEISQTIDCIIVGANPPTKEYGGEHLDEWKYWVTTPDENRLPIDYHYFEYMNGGNVIPVTKAYYNKWAGSLRLGLVKNGKIEYFGDLSGLTEEILGNWQQYKGRVCEVSGMQIDEVSHHIRHPRFICWRDPSDKKIEDCTWEQVEDM